jgi:hypothetical protein
MIISALMEQEATASEPSQGMHDESIPLCTILTSHWMVYISKQPFGHASNKNVHVW